MVDEIDYFVPSSHCLRILFDEEFCNYTYDSGVPPTLVYITNPCTLTHHQVDDLRNMSC
jgi:hypothetical protein